jgi:signal peptidase I
MKNTSSTKQKSEKGSGSSAREGQSSFREWVKSFLVALVLFLIIRTFLVQTFVIISGSMESTLLIGDLLLVNRVAVGSRVPGTSLEIPGYSRLERGDVLVFDPAHEEDMKLVKRLMGLPGDTLEMRNKELLINGDHLSEPYAQHDDAGEDFTDPIMMWQRDFLLQGDDPNSYQPTRDDWGPITIPEGHYFMLGDNRDSSYDSRYWGLVERWRFEGRVVLIYFSYDKESIRPFPWLSEIRWGRIGDLVH